MSLACLCHVATLAPMVIAKHIRPTAGFANRFTQFIESAVGGDHLESAAGSHWHVTERCRITLRTMTRICVEVPEELASAPARFPAPLKAQGQSIYWVPTKIGFPPACQVLGPDCGWCHPAHGMAGLPRHPYLVPPTARPLAGRAMAACRNRPREPGSKSPIRRRA
jgi:hypothetical protein